MALIDDVKLALRISHTAIDSDIQDVIDACLMDLKSSGIVIPDEKKEEYALVKQAVKTYCKANLGLENTESEKYQRSYDLLKQHMSLIAEFRGDSVV
ncbi:DNA-packaging protein [Vallitalea pronyensis]|uniref:DNA-packaging protein n=1 Tax=Vallitalea pronyensis TaxID=1348613 RepID=A0A8J8MNX6_9FIRM|nr:head-tail connector protein [Vallitalea pronyensis]QUI24877.1 DNA-packaging protein [Vallitalea pronyensis]